jgi:hypothetical protein
VHIKLVNWEEGNYRVSDKPYPRGEVSRQPLAIYENIENVNIRENIKF